MSLSVARPSSACSDDAGRLVAALAQRLGAELVQTHISWVLLYGAWALKIKKPVHLGFLDATSLAVRRHLCEEELRLNRRLAPSLYVDVLPIGGTPDAPTLDGDGPAIEYAVRMVRFPADALWSRRLAQGRLQGADIDAFAARLARFHEQAAVAAPGTPFGEAAAVADTTLHVVQQLDALRPEPLPQALRDWARERRERMAATWQRRKAAGAVREGHGDLHLDNLVMLDGDATAFDCIEFDPALRWIDVLDDLAFALMDLVAHGRQDLAWRLLNRYLDHSGQHEGLPVLRECMAHRALVRALVHQLRAGAGTACAEAGRYLALAQRLIRPADARLLITCGVSGSGKSWLSDALLGCAHAVRLRSDVERKRLFGVAPLASSTGVPGGIYGEEAGRRTYARLRELAAVALAAGHRVIVDAAFLHAAERASFAALAAAHGVPFTIVCCTAPEPCLAARVQERLRRADDPSEADARVLAMQLASFVPPAAVEGAIVLAMDAPVDLLAVARGWLGAT